MPSPITTIDVVGAGAVGSALGGAGARELSTGICGCGGFAPERAAS